MIDVIILSICLAALIIGTITDIKTREVPDWLNYGLIFTGFGIRLIYSAAASDWWFILYGLAGFGAFFLVSLAMFYAGQWGGGDAKMFMGLGAMLGLNFNENLFLDSFLVGFFINLLFVGALYGLLWSSVLAVAKRKFFIKEFRHMLQARKFILLRRGVLLVILLILVSMFIIDDLFLRISLLSLSFLMLIGLYLWPFVKSVENACMYKRVFPKQLTEGDWIADDVKIDGKLIAGPKDLGIEKKQIKKLLAFYEQGKVNKIKIKEGIPFVPSFLIGFILALAFGNLALFLI